MELTPVPGQSISLADISRRLGEMEGQFNALLEKAAEHFRMPLRPLLDKRVNLRGCIPFHTEKSQV